MGSRDEICDGKSTFHVEMTEAAKILTNASSSSLVIIDELGRGTGTNDGSAIAYASLDHLVTQIKCVTLFVTHYPAVVELAEIFPENVVNFHMDYLVYTPDNGTRINS